MSRLVWFILGGVATLVGGVIAKKLVADYDTIDSPISIGTEKSESVLQEVRDDD